MDRNSSNVCQSMDKFEIQTEISSLVNLSIWCKFQPDIVIPSILMSGVLTNCEGFLTSLFVYFSSFMEI